MALKPLEVVIRVKDAASSVLGSIQAKATAVASAIAAAFGVSLFASSVRDAADFEAAMSRVEAAVGGSAEDLQALKKAAEDAGASTKFTGVQAAEALENLGKAGLNAQQAIATLPAVLALAEAGDIQLGRSAEYVTKAIMGLGLAFEDAGRVADVLAKGANATNTSVDGLAQALSYAAPVAKSLGLSLETTVAIIGKFADAGIDASRAGTALNSILSQFSDSSGSFRKELAAAGITTNNFEEALHQLAAAGPAGQKAILAVGQEAGPALRALLGQGMDALDGLKKSLEDSAGSAAATAAIMQNNLHGAFNGLASAWDTLKVTLGTPVLPILKDAVDQLAGSLRSAVTDGTIGRFGEAIATGFQAAIKWARGFLAEFDVNAITASLQDFAARADVALQQVGDAATNAGNIVRTAWGVMAAGTNTVIAAIYSTGVAATESAKVIVQGALFATEALSRVAMGWAKEKLESDAEAMRMALVGLSGVSDEFGTRASDAMLRAESGAETARNGFAGLMGQVDATAKSTAAAAPEVERIASSLDKQGKAAEAAALKTKDKQAADEAAVASLRQLREEYTALVQGGSIQAAAEKLQEVERAQRSLSAASAAAVQMTASAWQEEATKIDARSKALQAGMAVEQASLRNAIDQQKAIYEVARARGDETTAMSAQQAMRRLEIELLELTAKAKRAEAEAQLAAVAAKREEAQANTEYTEVKRLELDAAAKGAELKLKEAEGAEILAQKQRQLSDALGSTGGSYDKASGSADRYRQSVRSVTADLREQINTLDELNERHSRPGEQRQDAKPGDSRDNYDPGYGSPYSRPGQNPVNGQGKTKAEYDREQFLKGQNAVDNSLMFEIRDRLRAGTLTSDDTADIQSVIAALKQNADVNNSLNKINAAALSTEGLRSAQADQALRAALQNLLKDFAVQGINSSGTAAVKSNVYTVNVNLAGASAGTQAQQTMNFSDQASVDAFLRVMRAAKQTGSLSSTSL